MPTTFTLLLLLILLIFTSGFFSGSEIGMMSLNRMRLRHMVRQGHKGAKRVQRLLQKTDRLLGVILIGNTFANILASAIATILAVQFWGEVGVAVATFTLTIIVLIFAEIAPKTLAASYPERFAFIVSIPLALLLKILYPFVWFCNQLANGFLRLFGFHFRHKDETFTTEELRTVVNEAGIHLPLERQHMLLGILDLEKVSVEDIMVPLNEVVGIDLEEEWEDILDKITNSQHTRLPLYRGNLESVTGFVHVRDVLNKLAQEDLHEEALLQVATPAYFVPETTHLYAQLLNFRKEKERIALVVNEYGDLLGLITLEDILEEIVGEFTTDVADLSQDVHPQGDGSFLVDGTATMRELKRSMGWDLPTNGPKTLSGLIVEYVEAMPEVGSGMRINGYPIEVMQVKGNMVRTAKIYPALRKKD